MTSTGLIAPPVSLNTRIAEVVYDRDWRPRTLLIDALLKEQASTVSTTFAGTQAATDIVQEERRSRRPTRSTRRRSCCRT